MITAEFYLFYPNYAKIWTNNTVIFASATTLTDVSTGDIFFVNVSLTTTGTLVGQVLIAVNIIYTYSSTTILITGTTGTFNHQVVVNSNTSFFVAQTVNFYASNLSLISNTLTSQIAEPIVFETILILTSSTSAFTIFGLFGFNPNSLILSSLTNLQDLVIANDFTQSVNLGSTTAFLDSIVENAVPGTVSLFSTGILANVIQAIFNTNTQTFSSVTSYFKSGFSILNPTFILLSTSNYVLSNQQSIDISFIGISSFIVGIPELNKTFRDQKAVFHMVVQYSLGEVWDMTTPERKAVDFKAPGPEDWNQIASELQAVIKDLLTAPWHDLILENSWVNSPDYATLSYKKVGNQINLRGVITGGQSQNGTIISILPLGLRPVTPLTLTVNVPGGGTQVNGMTVLISVNGTIKCYSWGSAANIDFSNVRFFTDQ